MKNSLQSAGITLLLMLLFSCSSPNERKAPIDEKTSDTLSKSDSATIVAPVQNEHTHVVEISRMQFNPQELTIPAGDTVVWVNNDMTNHCVTEVNKSWTSSSLEPARSFKKAITKTTDYFCAIHVVMKGKIIVQ